jgi:DNA mismatch repair protein MutL
MTTPKSQVISQAKTQAKSQSEESREFGRIQLLQSDVVDQIAAGEVVERPAHLVKELVENAIDAGATSVEVEYDQGGRRVRVTDDGKGIHRDDLSMALARHATSKIAKADDLWNLHSFGFRGEALASIAAVSRLSLTSRQPGELAYVVRSEFGRISNAEAASGNPGTTILVEELFANVPARLKFMKSEVAENSQIKATLKALALSHENVEFRLRSKGKLEAAWPKAKNFLERAQQVLGQDQLYANSFEYEGHRAEVIFASPTDVTGNSRSILSFVENRWVQDRGLQAAVVDAYRGLLMHGEFPIACVRLTVPAGDVDVNIHPTKSQIKFRDSQAAFRAVNRALREGLEKAPWLKRESALSPTDGVRAATERFSSAYAASAQNLGGSSGSAKKMSVADLTRKYEPASAIERQDSPSLASAPVHSTGRFEAPEFNAVVFRTKSDVVVPAPIAAIPTESVGVWSRLQVIGQADLTYIVAQDTDRLVLVDQHAAHERVAYERLMRAWQSGEMDVQQMLLPISVDLEPDGAEALLGVSGELEKIGVLIDQVGPQAVAIRTKPALISDGALVKALANFAREICEKGGSFVIEKKIGDLCATMACHSVVRAGQSLSIEQMRSLLKQMDEFPLSSFCPHGRPVSVDYPFAKLERDFGRIV